MKNFARFCLILLVMSVAIVCSADINILVIGSTHPFDQVKGIRSLDKSKVIAEAQRNITTDTRVRGKMNVVFEEVYKARTVTTAVGGSGGRSPIRYCSHSLAQWYFWPEGREERLKNLKGEGEVKWDYILLVGDPYLIANMPGIYAEGVKLIADTVQQGSARLALLIPAGTESLAEIVCRVGQGSDIYVTPARVASQAMAKIRGPYTVKNPFAMKYVSKRKVTFNQTGSSSERGIEGSMRDAAKRCGVSAVKLSPKDGEPKIDFNYGRANTGWEKNKMYKVQPENFERSYGFPMQDHSGSAEESMLYGIDKRFYNGTQYNDGTDLGIAWDMIREDQIKHDIRAIPIRLMWAKLHDADPALKPSADKWHMCRPLLDATGTYMYTLLSGRCPMDDKPAADNQQAMLRWLPQKIGYETAWRMSHLTGRAPGFMVKPSDGADTLTPGRSADFQVKFHFKPTAQVTVAIASDRPSALSVKPTTLTFTPENYATAQKGSVTAGSVAGDTTTHVRFLTTSKDAIFDQLTDIWEYKITAPADK